MKYSSTTKTAIFLLFLTLASIAQAEPWTGHVSGYLGIKKLDDKDWGKLDDQGSIGVRADIKQASWPVSLAFGATVSGAVEEYNNTEGYDDDKDVAGTIETHLGVQKYFGHGSFKPYLAGGVAFVGAVAESTVNGKKIDDDDTVVGAWAGAGFIVELGSHFHVGLDVRYSEAEVTLFDVEREAGGVNAGIRLGMHW